MQEDVFSYPVEPALHADGSGRMNVSWHLNFAHSHLFVAYSGSLFAQDEMQVAEHPALGSLAEVLNGRRPSRAEERPLTKDDKGPSPILIRGVERRVAVKTDSN